MTDQNKYKLYGYLMPVSSIGGGFLSAQIFFYGLNHNYVVSMISGGVLGLSVLMCIPLLGRARHRALMRLSREERAGLLLGVDPTLIRIVKDE